GLPTHQLVTLTLSSGNGTILGTTTLDIGTGAGNGTVNFSGLEVDAAGSGLQITASSSGLLNAVSSSFIVNPGAYAGLQLLVPGKTAAPGPPPAKTGVPPAETAGSALNVTVNAVDSRGNVVKTVTNIVGLASSDLNAVLPANTSLTNGTRILSVT